MPRSPIRRETALDPLQREVFETGMGQWRDILGEGMGEADRALVGQGREALSSALGGFDPAFIQDIFEKQRAPQRRELEESTLPGIRESMVGAGDFWSTGRANLETEARESFQERMESQLADLFLQGREQTMRAIPMVERVSGIEQRSALERLRETLPWLNLPTELAYGVPRTGDGGGGGRRYISGAQLEAQMPSRPGASARGGGIGYYG